MPFFNDLYEKKSVDMLKEVIFTLLLCDNHSAQFAKKKYEKVLSPKITVLKDWPHFKWIKVRFCFFGFVIFQKYL